MSANPGALSGWFNRRDQNNSPNDDDPSVDAAAAQSTTGGGKDAQTPVVVWEAANRMEAQIVAGRLQSEGIPAIIRGESLGAIYGLTTGSLAAATVLVPAPLAEQAIAILADSVEWDDAEQLDAEQGDTVQSDMVQPDTLDDDATDNNAA